MTEITQAQFNKIYGELSEDLDAVNLTRALLGADINVKAEFKALGLPKDGKKIEAKVRNGDTLTGLVSFVETVKGSFHRIYIGSTLAYINLKEDAEEDPTDIVSWDYAPQWTYKYEYHSLVPYVILSPAEVWVASFRLEEDAKKYVTRMNVEAGNK